MTVYIDDMETPFGRMKMCHMIADTSEELLRMVDLIGVRRRWIQYPGTPREHFDISLGKKALAIENGARPVTWLQLSCMIRHRDRTGKLCHPRSAVARHRAYLRERMREKGKDPKDALP